MIGAVNIACVYRADVDELEFKRRQASVMSNERHSKVTPEELARKWNIGLETARATMNVTTQRGIRTSTQPMSRRVRVDHLDLHRKRLKGLWYCDTIISKVKSLLGNTVANVFTQGRYVKCIPLLARTQAGLSIFDSFLRRN